MTQIRITDDVQVLTNGLNTISANIKSLESQLRLVTSSLNAQILNNQNVNSRLDAVIRSLRTQSIKIDNYRDFTRMALNRFKEIDGILCRQINPELYRMNQITAEMTSPVLPRSVNFFNQIKATNTVSNLFGSASGLISSASLVGLFGMNNIPIKNSLGLTNIGFTGFQPNLKDTIGNSFKSGAIINGDIQKALIKDFLKGIPSDIGGKISVEIFRNKSAKYFGGVVVGSALGVVNEFITNKNISTEQRIANIIVETGMTVISKALGPWGIMFSLATNEIKIIDDKSFTDLVKDGYYDGVMAWREAFKFPVGMATLGACFGPIGLLFSASKINDKTFSQWAESGVKSSFNFAKNSIPKIGNAFVSGATSAWNVTSNLFNSGINKATNIGKAIVSKAESAWKTTVTALNDARNSVSDTLNKTVNIITSGAEVALNTVTNMANDTIQKVGNAINDVAQLAGNIATDVKQTVANTVNNIGNVIASGAESALDVTKNTINNVQKTITNKVKKLKFW